ncbi:MAG: hypothetical protein KAJ55_00420 [Anaerolineales bacterium]|nr:hypothetical protein [Anaerolineales bacterium]
MNYQPLDLFFTRNPTWLSRAIRWAEREKGEAKSEASHVGGIVTEGPIEYVLCIEALRKVKRHSLYKRYKGKGQMTIYRPLNIPWIDRQDILDGVSSQVGDKYGYLKIGTNLLVKLTGWKKWADLNVLDRFPICSYLYSIWFEKSGYRFGIDGKRATPDDMLDFCQANPDKWECVKPWGKV